MRILRTVNNQVYYVKSNISTNWTIKHIMSKVIFLQIGLENKEHKPSISILSCYLMYQMMTGYIVSLNRNQLLVTNCPF